MSRKEVKSVEISPCQGAAGVALRKVAGRNLLQAPLSPWCEKSIAWLEVRRPLIADMLGDETAAVKF